MSDRLATSTRAYGFYVFIIACLITSTVLILGFIMRDVLEFRIGPIWPAQTDEIVEAIVKGDDDVILNWVRDGHSSQRIVNSGFHTYPLICAAAHHRSKYISWLLDGGANPNDLDEAGVSAIHSLIASTSPVDEDESIRCITAIARAGGNIELPISGGDRLISTIMFASACGLPKMCEWLIQHGADPTVADFRGRTPLHHAVNSSRVIDAYRKPFEQLLHLLITNGVDANARNDKGETAIDIAVKRGAGWVADKIRDESKDDKL